MKTYRRNQTLNSLISALRGDRRGQIAIMFGLSALMIVTGVGAGVDLMRAYLVQQKITHVATLTCQYASSSPVQNLVYGTFGTLGSLTNFTHAVNTFLSGNWTSQGVQYPQSSNTAFTPGTTGTSSVYVATNVPTTFMQIANVTAIPVAASVNCYSATGPQAPQPPSNTTTGGSGGSGPQPIISEGFESQPCGGGAVCYIAPSGALSDNAKVAASPASFVASNKGYVGLNGIKWYVTGYCLETDAVGLINSTVPEGVTAAELDCDNGVGTAGNSAISTEKFLEVGTYELRWFYRARVTYPHYDPVYICGSSASDTSWANDTYIDYYGLPAGSRSNQINVYFDTPTTGGGPPFHYTLDKSEQLAGSNMIDQCVYATNWVERSVTIKVTTEGNYWLTFAADGANDSFGGQIDDIRLCQVTCGGTVQDNFPPSWLPANNGGNNKVLFEDTFESPSYANTLSAGTLSLFTNPSGNLNLSLGTSGASSGWPGTSASGWATAPTNEVSYNSAVAAQGLQNIWLNGANGAGVVTGRPLLLVPGFYNLAYDYVSNVTFPTVLTASCGATPAAANLGASGTLSGSAIGFLRMQPLFPITGSKTANTLAAFITNAQLASEPITGGALNSTTSYANPDPNVYDTPPATIANSTTPTVKPDAISLTNYSASATSALVDICGYSPLWTARSVNFQITKTGYYWLNFSTEMATPASYGGGTVVGGAIDDVKVTALGSPYMLSAPSSAVLVPAPAPAASTQISDPTSSFYIIADPLSFPAQ